MFKNRSQAGKKLAEKLKEYRDQYPLILALPRGGIPVGFEVAKKLHTLLDCLVVRKLTAPFRPEFGIGAIAPAGIEVLDEAAIDALDISRQELWEIKGKEGMLLQERVKLYRGNKHPLQLRNKTVILVDDGLATGVTARAAIKYILKFSPAKLIVAMPVCASDSCEGLRSVIRIFKDEVICLSTHIDFGAVGAWYQDFPQVSDKEVVSLLKKAEKFPKRPTKITKVYVDASK